MFIRERFSLVSAYPGFGDEDGTKNHFRDGVGIPVAEPVRIIFEPVARTVSSLNEDVIVGILPKTNLANSLISLVS